MQESPDSLKSGHNIFNGKIFLSRGKKRELDLIHECMDTRSRVLYRPVLPLLNFLFQKLQTFTQNTVFTEKSCFGTRRQDGRPCHPEYSTRKESKCKITHHEILHLILNSSAQPIAVYNDSHKNLSKDHSARIVPIKSRLCTPKIHLLSCNFFLHLEILRQFFPKVKLFSNSIVLKIGANHEKGNRLYDRSRAHRAICERRKHRSL